MAFLKVKTPFNIDLQFQPAQFPRRFFAWIIDFIILILYLFFMIWLIDSTFDFSNAKEFGLSEMFVICPFILYHFIFELIFKGQSVGKMITKIHVVNLDGTSPTVSQLLIRWLMRFLDFGMLWSFIFLASGNSFLGMILLISSLASFIIFVTSSISQRLGDIVASTTVVSKKLPYNLSDTIFKDLDMRNYRVVFANVMMLSDKDINIIDNIIKHNYKSNIENYLDSVAEKIKKALDIETDMPSEIFLETLMRDYNYLSRK